MAQKINRGNEGPIKPEHINAEPGVHFWDSFGNQETEISAKWLVKLAQDNGSWKPFTGSEIEDFYHKTAGYVNFSFNRLLDQGYILKEGDTYFYTKEFVGKCYTSSPA